MIKNFSDLWKAHSGWNLGVLIKEIRPLKTADIYLGYTPDEWFSFALPKVEKPSDLDLEEIKKVLLPIRPSTTVYLLEKHVKAGFPEHLNQNGYQTFGEDNWLVFDQSFKDLETSTSVKRIGLDEFPDYAKVTEEAYREEWGFDDKPYNDICRKVLTGEIKSKAPGFSAEFFIIYEDGNPAAGAGLFLTKNLGYFHNDATSKEYRKKGYHTSLIKERVRFCLNKGIKTLYSVADGDQSARNFRRCGFKPWQVAQLYTLKTSK